MFGEKVLEKNSERISVRVPGRWKSELAARKIKIAPVVRSVIFNLLQTSDQVLKNRPVTKSKSQAASIYNSLNEFFVRTKSSDFEGFEAKMFAAGFKIPVFRTFYLPRAQPEELVVLARFLAQEEFAEEILNDVYHG